MKISNKYKEFYKKNKEFERNNLKRKNLAAYYTTDILIDEMYDILPKFSKEEITILEPAVGAGNFIPLIIEKYRNNKVNLILNDIDKKVLNLLKKNIYLLEIPSNFNIEFTNKDYLLDDRYNNIDLIIGNPPYMNNKEHIYNKFKTNKKSTDLYSFFLEKSMKESNYVCYIIPKTFLDTTKYYDSRNMFRDKVEYIIDFASSGFKDVRIETMGMLLHNEKTNEIVKIKSLKHEFIKKNKSKYIFDNKFKSWLIYRNEDFDKVANNLNLGIFSSYRDRQITNKFLSIIQNKESIRVLRSRNIGDRTILNIEGYDKWISKSDIEGKAVEKFLNKKNVIAIPNMTYYPRAIFLPPNTVVNGSVALLESISKITEKDLAYFATDEFREYYKIARNYSERTLNIDNNSVYFFGIRKDRND